MNNVVSEKTKGSGKLRLGFISDLHIDYNEMYVGPNIEKNLVEFFSSKSLDYLFISGDISSDSDRTLSFVNQMNKTLDTKVFFVPGNHDVWTIDRNSYSRLKELSNSGHCLVDKKVTISDDWCVVGAFPWYDYSLETLGYEKEFYENRRGFWVDDAYTNWGKENSQFVVENIERLDRVISKIPRNKNIIVIEHFVPRKEFIVSKNDVNWNFGNAFMGTRKIKDLCRKYKNIRVVHFGHTHKRFGTVVLDGVEYVCSPVGYKHEWSSNDIFEELESCLIIKKIS